MTSRWATARFRRTYATIPLIVSMFSGTTSSSATWIEKVDSRNVTSSRTPIESIKPASKSESDSDSDSISPRSWKFSAMNSRTVALMSSCIELIRDSPRGRVDQERLEVGRGAGHRLSDEEEIEELDG